jgi:putative flippase GtrA
VKKRTINKLIEELVVFLKAQVSSLVGGGVDYAIMVFFTEVFHVHYTISIAIGGIFGAVINFGINKGWTFRAKDKPYKHGTYIQIFKFSLVVINSIVLKSTGTYLITNYLKIDYKISRIIVDLIVSLAFNFTLQRRWVFNRQSLK